MASSTKAKIALVEGAGFSASLFTLLRDAVHGQGGTDLDIHVLATPEGQEMLEEVARIISEKRAALVSNIDAVTEPYSVTVDHSLTLGLAIDSGGFDRHNDLLDRLYWSDFVRPDGSKYELPKFDPIERDLLLFSVSAYFGTDYEPDGEEILAALDKLRLKPGGIAELLAFGKKHPDMQRKLPIAAFGSMWTDPQDDRIKVPVLWGSEGERRLGLPWRDGIWVPEAKIVVSRA